jgi:hypothetical protein
MCEQQHIPNSEIDRIWAEEGERRLDAYLRGETTSRDASEVLAKHLDRKDPASGRGTSS